MGRSKIKNSKGEAGDRDVVREVEERCVSIISNLFQVCCVLADRSHELYVRGRREDAGVQKYRLLRGVPALWVGCQGAADSSCPTCGRFLVVWPLRKRCSSQAVAL